MNGHIQIRAILALLVLALGILLAVSSCSLTAEDADETTDTTPIEDVSTSTDSDAPHSPERGGAVVIGEVDEPTTLNSFLPGGGSLVASVIGQTYAAGVQLVTELPTPANGGVLVNDDGTMTITYTIRDEANWDDGTAISGSDFQFTLDIILDPQLPISKTNYEDILGTVVGSKSFSYTMATPTVRYELMFSEIIPRHAVEGSDFVGDWNDVRWPSAGPFVFDDIPGIVENPNIEALTPLARALDAPLGSGARGRPRRDLRWPAASGLRPGQSRRPAGGRPDRPTRWLV